MNCDIEKRRLHIKVVIIQTTSAKSLILIIHHLKKDKIILKRAYFVAMSLANKTTRMKSLLDQLPLQLSKSGYVLVGC